MGEIVLTASPRNLQGKFRDKGFIPGIIYGRGIDTTPVKFNEKAVRKAISDGGSSARVWVEFDESKKFGFIREVQWHLTKDQLVHIDVQLVPKNQEINLQIPIFYKGIDQLRSKQLRLHINKAEIDAKGKMGIMPDLVEVDVSGFKLGESISLTSFNLHNEIVVNDNDEEAFATVVQLETISEEELETSDMDANKEPALVGETI